MRYLLDTNIISNVAKPAPAAPLMTWMSAQSDMDLFIASLTVAEIWRGILEKPRGKRRDQLETWFSGPEGPQALFAGRVLPFDETPHWFGHGLWRTGDHGADRTTRSIPSLQPWRRSTDALSPPTMRSTLPASNS